ncbi:MAG: HAD-IB family phosphatase [Clostridium sp.]
MNIYDFDKTIYDGDSTLDFYKYSIKKRPYILFRIIKAIIYMVKYKLNIIEKEKAKECFYEFLKDIPDIDKEIIEFWDINDKKIKKWYLNQIQDTDIIISASPEFILKPIITRLGIKEKNLLSSIVDKKTGKYTGKNCYGEEKINRLKEYFKINNISENVIIENAYTDSLSDKPLLNIAKKGYLVKGNKLIEYIK